MSLAEQIKGSFNRRTRQLGNQRFLRQEVEVAYESDGHASVWVDGPEGGYEVELDWDEEYSSCEVSCTCDDFGRAKPCEHIWSAALALDAHKNPDVNVRKLLEDFKNEGIDAETGQSLIDEVREIVFGDSPVTPEPTNWRANLDAVKQNRKSKFVNQDRVARNSNEQLWYVVSLEDLEADSGMPISVYSRLTSRDGEPGKFRAVPLLPSNSYRFTNPDDEYLFALFLRLNSEVNYTKYGYHVTGTAGRLTIPEEFAEVVIPRLCKTGRFRWRLTDEYPADDAKTLAWDGDSPWQFRLNLVEDNEQGCWDLSCRLERGEEHKDLNDLLLASEMGFLFFSDSVSKIASAEQSFPWISAIGNSTIQVPFEDRADFIQHITGLPDLLETELPESLRVERIRKAPVGHFSFVAPINDDGQSFTRGKLQFDYGDLTFDAHGDSETRFDEEVNALIERDPDLEQQLTNELESLPVQPIHTPGGYSMTLSDTVSTIRTLIEKGWIVDSDGTKFKTPGDFSINVVSGVDWFDLEASIDFNGMKVSLPALLKAIQNGDRFIRLGDGTHGLLPETWLHQQKKLLSLGEIDGDAVRFKNSQALFLDALLAERENVEVDRSFKAYRKKLQALDGIKPVKEPQGFTGELRPYQAESLGWFSFLREFNFGGCLADDMGLGKTVQVLALLQSRKRRRLKKDEVRRPSLVMVPKSLVFNWLDEAKRFAPKLRTANYTGSDRRCHLDVINDLDVLVSTYGTVRRDIADLKDIEFDYVILDEAQAIKNHQSQSAKAARLLQGDHRLAMTGTPIENHLGELWSLFEFLNPGMLGSSAAFQAISRNTREPDPEALEMLSKGLQPFILRRTKKQVLTDLPEKTEQTLFCEMEKKQRKLYDELRDYYRMHLSKEIKKKGLQKAKIHVLEALLRLRQAACHPGLVDAKRIKERSAKLDMLMEQLEGVMKKGRKVLVFSQFTSLLAIVKEHLDKAKITYEYLDGKTNQRGAHVKRFQEDENCQLFLISLKAGGHGLNLTAAEYVFILDPWWNPAVEAQAVDRAHRIGQTEKVFAYRLICRDTVEEKILQLQQEKRDLADAIVGANSSILRSLSADDLQLLLS